VTETERWLASFFERQGAALDQPWEAVLNEQYFDLGLVDSLGLVELIVGIEGELGARLESTHVQDPRFGTIRGLAQIVDELAAR